MQTKNSRKKRVLKKNNLRIKKTKQTLSSIPLTYLVKKRILKPKKVWLLNHSSLHKIHLRLQDHKVAFSIPGNLFSILQILEAHLMWIKINPLRKKKTMKKKKINLKKMSKRKFNKILYLRNYSKNAFLRSKLLKV